MQPVKLQKPAIMLLNNSGSDPFPFLKDAWSMFSQKGSKTIFISIGSSKSAIADLEIAEIVGCPITVVPGSEEGVTGWLEAAECIKTHEPCENPKSDFSKGADDKWVLPKYLRIETLSIPYWNSGILEMSPTYSLKAVPFYEWVQKQCVSTGLNPEDTRIDILKIDTGGGLERGILSAALDAGFRPSLILVNWSKSPDMDLSTLITAGHLQNSGYVLLEKEETKFLYVFFDSDLYTTCSWENKNVMNPLIDELVSSFKNLSEPVPEPILTEEGTAPLVTPESIVE